MRRYVFDTVLAFIVFTIILSSFPVFGTAEEKPGYDDREPRDVVPFDWSGWERDADGNGMDDLLEEETSRLDGAGDLIGVNVHFSRYPSLIDVQRITSKVPSIRFHHVGTFSTAVYLSVPEDEIPALLSLKYRDITMFEYRPPIMNTLDVSSPATRSRGSENYSPMTARDLDYTGEGIVVAVIDSGVDNNLHESLRGKYVYGVDFTGTSVIYGLDPDDIDGHGTHVAGTALGTGGTSGTYMGTAPDAELVDLRYARVGGDFTGNADKALEWVIENHEEHDISVTSCSWGSTITTSGRDTTSRLVNQLVDEGVVVVVAAGNDGEQGMPSPASADGALTVGALNDRSTVERDDDSHEWYSNRGPRSSDGDLDEMDELKPDVIAPGNNIRSAKHNSVRDYVDMTGTSMAAPHVSGIVALMLQANPRLTPGQVKDILRDAAQQRRSPSVPETDEKYNYRSGWGAVDAYGAVKRAQDLLSYEADAPSKVMLDRPFQVNVSGHFTKTDYDSQDDTVRMELFTPLLWGPPEEYNVDAMQEGAQVTLLSPAVKDGMWTVGGEVEYMASVEDVEPVLNVEVSPMGSIGDVETLRGSVSFNGIDGYVEPTNVTISYESLPPDLSVISPAIWFSDGTPESGDRIDISARINNTGATDTENVLVRFIDGPELTGRTIGEDTVDVGSFSHAVAGTSWEANPGIHAITVVVDPEDEIAESNEDNNSAERPLTVMGVNPPPIARLEVSPDSGTVMTRFNFDASGSTDTNIRGGSVVLYKFDFGDGESTEWIDRSQVEHIYREGGSYTASVIVEDNGGVKSQNDADVTLNVSDIQSDEMDLYMNSSFGLSEEPGQEGSVAISTSRSPSVIGAWESDPSYLTLVIHTAAIFEMRIVSPVQQEIDIEIVMTISGTVFSDLFTLQHPGGGNETFVLDLIVRETELIYLDTLVIEIGAAAVSEEALLLTGEGGSMVEFFTYIKENQLPLVDAGPDLDVKAGNQVVFEGSASDNDSGIHSSRWDFDGDGQWDVQGDDVLTTTYRGYAEEGSYTAELQVTDRDGGKSSDTARVTVRSSDFNYAPTVTISCPSNSTEGTLELKGTSDDDNRVRLVEVKIDGPIGPENATVLPWTAADGVDPWTFSHDTTGMADGSYMISARAFDGDRFSRTESCWVYIENPNAPPIIERMVIAPVPLKLDGDEELLIQVDVLDPDMPMDEVYVTADLTALEGPEEALLNDDGLGPDTKAGDRTYTISFVPPRTIPTGTYTFTVKAVDRKGASDTDQESVELISAVDVDVDIPDGPYITGRKYLFKVSIGMEEPVGRVVLELGNLTLDLGDDGMNGDRVAGDGVYSRSVELDQGPGRVAYSISVISKDDVEIYSMEGELLVEGPTSAEDGTGPELVMVLVSGSVLIIALVLVLVLLLLNFRRGGTDIRNSNVPEDMLTARVLEE
ncbi:MAG: S8 family serine peptidase [Thermoplasmatota archaeon]